jgi:hypothetical protein
MTARAYKKAVRVRREEVATCRHRVPVFQVVSYLIPRLHKLWVLDVGRM